MAKKIIISFIVIFTIMIPLNVSAKNSGDMLNEAEEKYNRHEEQGTDFVDNSSKDVKDEIQKNTEQVKLLDKSNSANAEDALEKLSKGTYRFTGKFLFAVQKNSFPVCLLGVIAGALIFFILGPRSIVRRRYGSMLMFGAFSLWVIAQIAPVIFLLMIQ